MDIVPILLIAFGLAMDAFAVSVSCGIMGKGSQVGNALRMASSFGSFQAIMPLMGWLGGLSLAGPISGFDHWIAFGLLVVIGGKMVFESVKSGPEKKCINPADLRVLMVLSVATSIDALAVGFSFALLKAPIVTSAVIIGVVTFGVSLTGAFLGSRFRGHLENKAAILGGLILIAIGTKILAEHLIQTAATAL